MEIENSIPNREGMSRQERRALERAQAKLKKSLEDLPFGIDWGKVKPVSLQSLPKKNGFISIFGQCEGFTYYLKDVKDGGESKTKTLGDPIGGSVASSGNKPIDGDGDGYVASTPGGADDTRVSPRQEKRPKGEITKGNIDLNNRPVVKNRDGSISTVRSMTITEGNTAVVIPTVIKRPNGSGVIVSDREAIKYYQRSGQHLGKFSNIQDADTYARNLHNQQAAQYPNPGKSLFGEGLLSFKGVPKPKKKPPTVTSTDINNLAVRVRQHNAKAKATQRANLRDLKNVYLRGLQDGDKTSANKRVSKFLSLLMSDKPKDVKYFDDNDLLPLDHPWRNRKTTKKWAGFDDGEYGVKYAEKCCPQVVKRYHAK